MTTFVLIEDGIVIQKQPYPQDGFIEAPANIVCGMPYFETPEEVVAWEAEQVKQISSTIDPWANIKQQRNQLLANSDWVTLRAIDTGIPVSDEWQDYREALRDITDNFTNPEDVVWPTIPS